MFEAELQLWGYSRFTQTSPLDYTILIVFRGIVMPGYSLGNRLTQPIPVLLYMKPDDSIQ